MTDLFPNPFGGDLPQGDGRSAAPSWPGHDTRSGRGAQPGHGPQPGYGPQPGHGAQPGHGVRAGQVADAAVLAAPDPLADGTTGGRPGTRSKILAGLLQLFLGGLGAGRWYLGHWKIALAQLVTYTAAVLAYAGGLVATDGGTVSSGIGSVLLLLGSVMSLAVGIWVLVDAIRMFLGNVTDAQGRPLR